MARTALTPQRITSTGTAVTLSPANVDGHSMPLRARLLLLVANADAGAKVVTIPTPAQVDGLDVTERTVTVPAGASRYINLGANTAYRQADGNAYINFDSVTSVTVALIQA